MLDIQNFFQRTVVAIQDSTNNPTIISNMSNLSTVTTTATVQPENSIIFVFLPDRSTVWCWVILANAIITTVITVLIWVRRNYKSSQRCV